MASREEDISSSALEGGAPAVPVPPDRVFEAKPIWKRMVVILAGVTMNALFAWGVFAFLAYKNGRQIDPVTTVGLVVADSLPPSARALKQIQPGSRILSINGDSVKSWDEVVSGIVNTPDSDVQIRLSDGSKVVLPIHPDALEERVRAAQALQPFRAAIVGEVQANKPAGRAGIHQGDTIVAVNGRRVRQWYDLLETPQGSPGQDLTLQVARGGQRISF